MAEQHTCIQEERLERLEGKVEGLENIREVVTRLATLTELQHEQNKERDNLIKQQSETLITIKEFIAEEKVTLQIMNTQMKKTDEKVEELDKKLDEQKDKGKFDVWGFVNNKLIPFLIGAGIIYVLKNPDLLENILK